jgi:hypothetical protein
LRPNFVLGLFYSILFVLGTTASVYPGYHPSLTITGTVRPWHGRFEYYLSIIAIVKNEALYIAEWLEYHLIVGVEHFFLNDHNSTDTTTAVLETYVRDGLVDIFNNSEFQCHALSLLIPVVRDRTCWLAHIDCDEFLLPLTVSSVPEFLAPFENVTGIVINWRIFGSGGATNRTKGLVIERFRDVSPVDLAENRHTKTILNPRTIWRLNVHWGIYLRGADDVDVYGRLHDYDMLQRPPVYHGVRINHYFTKSYEEWIAKQKRGRADTGGFREDWEWTPHAKPWGVNDTLMDRYVPMVQERLARRFPGGWQDD